MTAVFRRGVWVVAALAVAGGTAFGAGATNTPYGSWTSTAAGLHTYDSDQIDLEGVAETGKGVYVAVLDTGLVPNWKDYFPAERVATQLGTGFEQPVTFRARTGDPCGLEAEVGTLRQSTWVGSSSTTHGSHVASTILGYFYESNADKAAGFALGPVAVRGIAPDVTVIPVKVLADYQVPARPKCTDPDVDTASQTVNFGTSEMVAAGIDYATDLAIRGYRPMVVNMSLGGDALEPVEQAALDRAIANGVIVVAAAGNDGENGMHYPGAYAPVISAGASGWTGEWVHPDTGAFYRLWWLKGHAALPAGSGDTVEGTADDVFVAGFSSRAYAGQELDLLAPGNWVRGPFPGLPGYSHLPWWSKGIGDLVGLNPGNFYYVGGTSMASPHVAGAAAMLLERDPSLTQAQVESVLKSSALAVAPSGTRAISDFGTPATVSWGTTCTDDDGATHACDAVGSGLLQVDDALALVP